MWNQFISFVLNLGVSWYFHFFKYTKLPMNISSIKIGCGYDISLQFGDDTFDTKDYLRLFWLKLMRMEQTYEPLLTCLYFAVSQNEWIVCLILLWNWLYLTLWWMILKFQIYRTNISLSNKPFTMRRSHNSVTVYTFKNNTLILFVWNMMVLSLVEYPFYSYICKAQKYMDHNTNKQPIACYKNMILDLCIREPQLQFLSTFIFENPFKNVTKLSIWNVYCELAV